MLSDQQKVDVRRHCGYPAFGNQAAQAFGHRFFTHYGSLEYRMNNLSPEEETVAQTYLSQLNTMEQNIVNAQDNLDTEQAAVWSRNKSEIVERMSLYAAWARRLAAFMGVPVGPSFAGGSHSVTIVV